MSNSPQNSPQTMLARARRALDIARERCPHWDYEDDGDGHECCDVVATSLREYRRLGRIFLSARSP